VYIVPTEAQHPGDPAKPAKPTKLSIWTCCSAQLAHTHTTRLAPGKSMSRTATLVPHSEQNTASTTGANSSVPKSTTPACSAPSFLYRLCQTEEDRSRVIKERGNHESTDQASDTVRPNRLPPLSEILKTPVGTTETPMDSIWYASLPGGCYSPWWCHLV
jgi:hypothetical protein